MSDGFAMECPDCGGSLEIETPPVGGADMTHPLAGDAGDGVKWTGGPSSPPVHVEDLPAGEPGKTLDVDPEAVKFNAAGAPLPEPETDLPSYPPYSVGVFIKGKDAGRDNLSGPQAIEYARTALADSKTIGIEIYDKVSNLVAAGTRENGLRLIRKLADVEAAPAKVEGPEPPAIAKLEASKKAPSEFADLLIDHLERISKAAGLSWEEQDGIKLWAALADLEEGIVASAVTEARR